MFFLDPSPLRRLLLVVALSASLAGARSLEGQSIASLVFSADSSVSPAGVVVEDEAPAREILGAGVTLLSIGEVPASADLQALAAAEAGDWLLAFDTTVQLAGGVVAEPNDVVRWDGASYSLAVDGSAVGLPSDRAIDALAWVAPDTLLFSFDTTVRLGGIVVEDEDLVQLSGGSFSLFFDGSAHGIPPSLDLDAAAYDPIRDRLWVSLDGSGVTAGGIVFEDEDVLALDRGAGTWSLAYDGSAAHSEWAAADLDALEVGTGSVPLFSDGFETGDTSAWTATVP